MSPVQGRSSRRQILATAGAAGAAALVAGCGANDAREASEPDGRRTEAPGDIAVVSFALTLEYFEAAL